MHPALETLIGSLDSLEGCAGALRDENGRYRQALARDDLAEVQRINGDIRVRLAVLETVGDGFRDALWALAAALGAPGDVAAIAGRLQDADRAVFLARMQGLQGLMRQMALAAAVAADLMLQAEAVDAAKRSVN